MKNRISKRLEHHKNELRKRALKETNPKLRSDYWRLYYDAVDIGHEIREMVMAAEIRRLVDIMIAAGVPDTYVEDETDEDDKPPEDKPDQSDDEPDDHEDDIPPRQMGLWD